MLCPSCGKDTGIKASLCESCAAKESQKIELTQAETAAVNFQSQKKGLLGVKLSARQDPEKPFDADLDDEKTETLSGTYRPAAAAPGVQQVKGISAVSWPALLSITIILSLLVAGALLLVLRSSKVLATQQSQAAAPTASQQALSKKNLNQQSIEAANAVDASEEPDRAMVLYPFEK